MVFSWAWENRPDWQELVSVEFKQEGPGSGFHFEHSKIDQNTSHDYLDGWKRTFRKLEKLLEAI